MQTVLPQVHIEQYEGPYDLLVELAKKEHVHLAEISLKDLTDSFLTYIKDNNIHSEIIGSFLIVASTLLLIKVRQMLPTTKVEEEEISNLQSRLAVYEQFRNAAEQLATKWNVQNLLPAHFFAEGKFQEPGTLPIPDITATQLQDALKNLIGRIPAPAQPTKHLVQRGRSLKEIFSMFEERLQQAKKLVFQDTVHGYSRQEQAVSFLAVLELARNKSVRLEQEDAFGTLTVHSL